MKERLEKFIKTEGLTPSRFAEIMGVQPSSISHILGGRNKPSFDFIEKMLLRFPKVNPDWLLLGKGTVYRTADMGTPEANNLAISPESPLRPNKPASESATLPFEATALSASTPETAPAEATQPLQADKPQNNPARTTTASAASTTAPSFQQALPQIPENQIEHIVVFLKDKTFISYRPK